MDSRRPRRPGLDSLGYPKFSSAFQFMLCLPTFDQLTILAFPSEEEAATNQDHVV